jgi:hypothetical protein
VRGGLPFKPVQPIFTGAGLALAFNFGISPLAVQHWAEGWRDAEIARDAESARNTESARNAESVRVVEGSKDSEGWGTAFGTHQTSHWTMVIGQVLKIFGRILVVAACILGVMRPI